MALKIELKPGERLILGNALITNDNERIRFYIEGDIPILREKYVLTPKEINSPCKAIYYLIQEMYLSHTPRNYHKRYFSQIAEVQKAAPSLALTIDKINSCILTGDYYNALKEGIDLIKKEAGLLKMAEKGKKDK